MGWDAYRGQKRYYSRTRRVGGRFVREYIGGGEAGKLAAAADALKRAERQAQAQERRAQQEAWQAAEQILLQLGGGIDLLARAALLSAGCRQHARGAWRRTRHDHHDHPFPDPKVSGPGEVPAAAGAACPAG
jgi:hypothetical protein